MGSQEQMYELWMHYSTKVGETDLHLLHFRIQISTALKFSSAAENAGQLACSCAYETGLSNIGAPLNLGSANTHGALGAVHAMH